MNSTSTCENINDSNNKDYLEIILWMNGKPKEYSFKYKLYEKNTLNLFFFKEKIISYIFSKKEILSSLNLSNSSKKNLTIYHLYNSKEIDLEDSDISYLSPNEIIFFSFDNSEYKSSNHFYQYEFIRWIKSGGYGKVFLASHIITKKQYAIKQIDTTNFSNENLYNISREHMILRSMLHKNVIHLHDSFAHDNKFFTVMDFAEGGELSTLLNEKGKLREENAKKIFKQIYEAVIYIHGKNIIHRDLKPNNILFLDKERTHIVIIDFGISGFSNGNQKEKVKAGTIRFMPPEMAKGEEFESDRKFDSWSLGVILYRMVEGKYPFDGKNTKEICKNIIHSDLIFEKKVKISYSLRLLIEGLLEKNKKFRIDDDSILFNKWFEFGNNSKSNNNIPNINDINDTTSNNNDISPDKIEIRRSKSIKINGSNYLSPTKSHKLKCKQNLKNTFSNFNLNNYNNKNINNICRNSISGINSFNSIIEKENLIMLYQKNNSYFLPLIKNKGQKINNYNISSINPNIEPKNYFLKSWKKSNDTNDVHKMQSSKIVRPRGFSFNDKEKYQKINLCSDNNKMNCLKLSKNKQKLLKNSNKIQSDEENSAMKVKIKTKSKNDSVIDI